MKLDGEFLFQIPEEVVCESSMIPYIFFLLSVFPYCPLPCSSMSADISDIFRNRFLSTHCATRGLGSDFRSESIAIQLLREQLITLPFSCSASR